MCGGFSITSKEKKLTERFKADIPENLHITNLNARPGQFLPVIKSPGTNKKPQIELMKWGYMPHWAVKANSPISAKKVINARSESIFIKPYFRESILDRRLMILADGFFEWKQFEKGKQQYRIMLKSEEPFAFAGIWDLAPDQNGEMIPHFAIITVEANDDVREIHGRMPVILLPEDEQTWLKNDLLKSAISNLLKPYPNGLLKSQPLRSGQP
jgi:putative SOS response-associated peptidase YedK